MFKVKVKDKMKVIVMVLATQIRFPENLLKNRQAGGSELGVPSGAGIVTNTLPFPFTNYEVVNPVASNVLKS